MRISRVKLTVGKIQYIVWTSYNSERYSPQSTLANLVVASIYTNYMNDEVGNDLNRTTRLLHELTLLGKSLLPAHQICLLPTHQRPPVGTCR
jgi:hypothetical protein